MPGHCAVCVRSAGRRVYHLLQMPEITWIGRYLEMDMGPFGPCSCSCSLWWEYVLCLQRDASGPEKASDDRAARCAGGILLFWAVISL